MGPTIRLLEDTLVDQIAAGEVIERPANLVKELLENAIDAKASAITVSVEDGGRGHVCVRDDGEGMSRADAALSIQRHATSKIASFDDLVQVQTLGFRGEALPSIGSVSRMTILTRRRDEREATRVVVEGGALREVAPAGGPPGTTVQVADLFYNVPARRKFLKARQTETARVFEVCQRAALSHPELRLVVNSDGRNARRYLPANTLVERAHQVFGDLALQELHAARERIALDAVLAAPELARAGARHLVLMVNGRPVVDRALARAVAFAYGDSLRPGHYPRGVLSIQIPPEDVDVNAHPQKTEVRFRHGAQLVDQVARMLASRLPASSSASSYWDLRLQGADGLTPPQGPNAVAAVAETTARYEETPKNGLRFVAQAGNSVLICESDREVFVLDRERADAARRSDELTTRYESGTLGCHRLLFPDRLHLSPDQRIALERRGEWLRSIGFDWSQLGEASYAVRAVPTPLADAPATRVFEAALAAASIEQSERSGNVWQALASAAATPNGSPLDEGAARTLLAAFCPSRKDHQACILARVPLPASTSDRDDG